LGTVARTAIIAGTASATVNAVNRRAAARAEEQQQAAAYQAEQQAAPPAADDLVAKLTELARLRDAGVLNAQEFEAAKAKLLAS
jgi:membrane protease subunit (stomatin/prohibitin family)